MDSPTFQIQYKRLNPQQKQAVDTIEGPVMVIAGPGTGKTQILTLRIANILLKTDINPDNILALTFTESAVLEMRKRLVSIIGTTGYKVQINTFHGFCNDVIRQNPEDFPYLISSEPITELEQIQILEELILNLPLTLLKPFGDPLYYVRGSLGAINELKKEGITTKIFDEAIKKQKADFETIEDLYHEKGRFVGQMKGKYQELQRDIAKNEELLLIYKEYNHKLQEGKFYDFNDMLLGVSVVLQKNKSLLTRLQERFQYVLIDEHQDTNATQNKIVEFLLSYHENPNLFVVGDEKQAIFRFQGASLENFLYFKNLYPEATLINLEHNYRSHQALIDASGSLIEKNLTANLLPKQTKLKSGVSKTGESIKVASFQDFYSEYFYLAEDIKKKIKDGADKKEIAIICRNNKDVMPVMEVLQKEGIPFTLDSDQDIFSDVQVKKLMYLLRAIENFGKDEYLTLALHVDFLNIDSWDIYKLIHATKVNKKTLYEILIELSKGKVEKGKGEGEKSSSIPSADFSPLARNDNLSKELELQNSGGLISFFEKLKQWEKLSRNESLEEVFIRVINDSGFLKDTLSKTNALDLVDKIASIYEEVKRQTYRDPKFNLGQFLRYLDLLQNHRIILKKPVRSVLKDAVRIMTAHKSKGLEFDFVYIPQVFDGHWGNLRRRSSLFEIPWEILGLKLNLKELIDENERSLLFENEDERRLFYVALTRARKEVLVSFSQYALEGKEQLPSQFISEISDEYKQDIKVTKFEEKFAQNKALIFQQSEKLLPDMKNLKYLQEIFVERGLSATGLNNYIECPWKFFYCNLLSLPSTKTKQEIYGSAIHASLCQFVRKLKFAKPDDKFLVDEFIKALRREPLITEGEFEEMRVKGEKSLKDYFQYSAKDWQDNRIPEFSIRGVKLNEMVLNGVIDMIEYKEGGVNVMVYDFKTGRPKGRSEVEAPLDSEKGNFRRQLLFYKILLDHLENQKINAVEGVIEFVETDVKGRYHHYPISFAKDEVSNMIELIKKVWSEIIALEFWDKTCGKKDCEYCQLREMVQI